MDIADYPWEWAPIGHEEFDLNGSAAIAAGQTVAAPLNGAGGNPAYSIPLLQKGYITWLGIELSSYAAGVFYQLLLDGVPMRDYSRVTVPIGAPNTPVKRRIVLRPNQKFSLNIVNGSAGIVAARWSIYGWYYPAGRIL